MLGLYLSRSDAIGSTRIWDLFTAAHLTGRPGSSQRAPDWLDGAGCMFVVNNAYISGHRLGCVSLPTGTRRPIGCGPDLARPKGGA